MLIDKKGISKLRRDFSDSIEADGKIKTIVVNNSNVKEIVTDGMYTHLDLGLLFSSMTHEDQIWPRWLHPEFTVNALCSDPKIVGDNVEDIMTVKENVKADLLYLRKMVLPPERRGDLRRYVWRTLLDGAQSGAGFLAITQSDAEQIGAGDFMGPVEGTKSEFKLMKRFGAHDPVLMRLCLPKVA